MEVEFPFIPFRYTSPPPAFSRLLCLPIPPKLDRAVAAAWKTPSPDPSPRYAALPLPDRNFDSFTAKKFESFELWIADSGLF